MKVEEKFMPEIFLKRQGVLAQKTLSTFLAQSRSWRHSHRATSALGTVSPGRSYEVAYPNEIVGSRGKGKHPSASLDTFMAGFPHQPDGLCPSKDLFDHLALPLTD